MGNGDYVIVKCSDCFRVTYVNDDSLHTHVKSRRIAEKLIYVACKSKIPLDEDYIFYESLYRILPACELKHKAYEVMIAKSKRKQEYYNPFRKRAGGKF